MTMTTTEACPNCGDSSSNLLCAYCGDSAGLCDCGRSEEIYCFTCNELFVRDDVEELIPDCDCDDADGSKLVCDTCNVYRESFIDPWLWQDMPPYCDCTPEAQLACVSCGVVREEVTDDWQWEADNLYYGYKCRHYDHAVEFANGVRVYGSSMRDREAKDEAPDFGLYMDGGWEPACDNTMIGWPDFGIPKRWGLAVAQIIDAYKRAEDGYWVEVGCIGGHGRTGTVLACMAVLSGMDGFTAVEWIRDNYCTNAIETDEQEWWVHWFDCYINGGTTEPYPVIKSWMTKKEKKRARKEKPITYAYKAIDWREKLTLERLAKVGRKPEYEYGAVVSRTVRKKSKKKNEVEIVDDDTETDLSDAIIAMNDDDDVWVSAL